MKLPYRLAVIFAWLVALTSARHCLSQENETAIAVTPTSVLALLDTQYVDQGGNPGVFTNSFYILLENGNLTLISHPVVDVINMASYLEEDPAEYVTVPIESQLTEQFESQTLSLSSNSDCAELIFLIKRIDPIDLRASLSLISFPNTNYSYAATEQLLAIVSRSDASAVSPILDELSQNENENAQLALIESLGALGPNAISALPALNAIKADPNSSELLKLAASSAISSIGPAVDPSLGPVNFPPTGNEAATQYPSKPTIGSPSVNQSDVSEQPLSQPPTMAARTASEQKSNGDAQGALIISSSYIKDILPATLQTLRNQWTNGTPEQRRMSEEQMAQIKDALERDARNGRSPTQYQSAGVLQDEFGDSTTEKALADKAIDWGKVLCRCPLSVTQTEPFTITVIVPPESIIDPEPWKKFVLEAHLTGDLHMDNNGEESQPRDLINRRETTWSWTVNSAGRATNTNYRVVFFLKDKHSNNQSLTEFHAIDGKIQVVAAPMPESVRVQTFFSFAGLFIQTFFSSIAAMIGLVTLAITLRKERFL